MHALNSNWFLLRSNLSFSMFLVWMVVSVSFKITPPVWCSDFNNTTILNNVHQHNFTVIIKHLYEPEDFLGLILTCKEVKKKTEISLKKLYNKDTKAFNNKQNNPQKYYPLTVDQIWRLAWMNKRMLKQKSWQDLLHISHQVALTKAKIYLKKIYKFHAAAEVMYKSMSFYVNGIKKETSTHIKAPKIYGYPYKTIVSIEPVFKGSRYLATAFLIHPQLLLTAAHNVYNPKVGFASKIDAFFCRISEDKCKEVRDIHSFIVSNAYIKGNKFENDYAILFFKKSLAAFGNLGLKIYNTAQEGTLTGYKGLFSSKYQCWESHGKLHSNKKENPILYHEILSEHGQSGSPIYLRKQNGTFKVVGVHVAGSANPTNCQKSQLEKDFTLNKGVKINKRVIENISVIATVLLKNEIIITQANAERRTLEDIN